VEDTYYSDSPSLNRAALARRLDLYRTGHGWAGQVRREEQGVLPVAIGGDFDAYWRGGGAKLAKAGMRAGMFHPTTGYSLPDAIRLACAVAGSRDFSAAALHDLTYGLARGAWDARRFYRRLDAMLFRAAEPDGRYRVLERFYRLDRHLIGRFYAGQSTMSDKARILLGKPPVPIRRALRALRGVA
jgi:lycopene beta-cyclase